jgi:hypothetical protein
MTQARSVTATFNVIPPQQFTLMVSKAGTGSGTVTSNPAGINCGATCSALFDFGTSVTLTASAASGSTFAGWSGEGCSGTGTCTVSMTQARSVTATFSTNNSPTITMVSPILPQQTQTITITGSGFGTLQPYDGNSPSIRIHDVTGQWGAGHIGPGDFDAVHLAVASWTDSQIVISGFTGAYGQNNWTLQLGDQVEVQIWNAQTGAGPAIYTLTVGVTTRSSCTWGLYIDDHQSGGGWESRLFLSNIDTQHAHTYEVFVLATNTVLTKSLSLGPNGIVELTCGDLQACGAAGWLYVQSDAPVLAATLFVINNVFGGGAFTAQSPVCTFGLP